MYKSVQFELIPCAVSIVPVSEKKQVEKAAKARLIRRNSLLAIRAGRKFMRSLPLNDNAVRFGAIGGGWQKEVVA